MTPEELLEKLEKAAALKGYYLNPLDLHPYR